MRTGTIACPQQIGPEEFCPEIAEVLEIETDVSECVCPQGHGHTFGAIKYSEVTWHEE